MDSGHVQCCRCRNVHHTEDRVLGVLKPNGGRFSLCPRCRAQAYRLVPPKEPV